METFVVSGTRLPYRASLASTDVISILEFVLAIVGAVKVAIENLEQRMAKKEARGVPLSRDWNCL